MMSDCCSVMSDSMTPWKVACQASLSMEFSRQEYWNGLPFQYFGYMGLKHIMEVILFHFYHFTETYLTCNQLHVFKVLFKESNTCQFDMYTLGSHHYINIMNMSITPERFPHAPLLSCLPTPHSKIITDIHSVSIE